MKIGQSLCFLEDLRAGLSACTYYPFYHIAPLPHASSPMWMSEPQNILFDATKNLWRSWQLIRPNDCSKGTCISEWVQTVSFNQGISWIPLGKTVFPRKKDIKGFFGGTVLRDWQNSAGFGNGAVLYLVTADTSQGQKVLRYWATDFTQEPVFDQVIFEQTAEQSRIDQVLKDFRVHWDGEQWVAVITLSYGMAFYGSADTQTWEKLSVWMAPDHGKDQKGGLESAVFYPIPIKSSEEEQTYLLLYIDHSEASGQVYGIVGTWDGWRFKELSSPQCLDYGCDMSAPNLSQDQSSGRLLLQGWMGNWNYVQHMPFKGFSNAETMLRDVSVTEESGQYKIAIHPFVEQDDFFPAKMDFPVQQIKPGCDFDFQNIKPGCAYKVELVLSQMDGKWPEEIIFSLGCDAQAPEKGMMFKYIPSQGVCDISRAKGAAIFPKERNEAIMQAWNRPHFLPVREKNGTLRLDFFVDHFSVEAFCPEAGTVATNVFFPEKGKQAFHLSCADHTVQAEIILKRASF